MDNNENRPSLTELLKKALNTKKRTSLKEILQLRNEKMKQQQAEKEEKKRTRKNKKE
ncbi:hypothetical protein [Raineya orbicola]|uniref:Uncharacterized protein n=1 Tax=Raineya orbicola TaxID=2016530 RepID=A0A2N3ICH2_9BACT|nr:hypothetical protein [Raineya orbicola]PKQ68042.1 hypothetical protein Rain11_1769 [Raineya orbicola]